MSPVRWPIIAALLLAPSLAGGAGAPVESLVVLPPLTPRDADAGVRLTPHAIAVDAMGLPWILDSARGRILLLNRPDGVGRSRGVGSLQAGGTFPYADLAASGTYLYLLDPSSPSLTLLDLDGYVREEVDLGAEVEAAAGRGFSPTRLLVGRSGDLWLIDTRGTLLRFDRRGRFLDAPLDALAGGDRPRRIADAALAPDDGIVLLDPTRPSILVLPASGGNRPPRLLPWKLAEPVALAVDADGNQYLLEASGRIRVLDANGGLLFDGTPAGTGGTGRGRAVITPDGILMRADPASGLLLRWRVVRAKPEDVGR